MEDIKQIIAKNISELRKQNNMTQAELGEKLNYSDKAISRWEHGDSLPDIEILSKLCDLFNVPFSYLISSENQKKEINSKNKIETSNKLIISLLAVSLVWFVATCIYVYSGFTYINDAWKVFIWAVPISSLVGIIFNKLFGKRKYATYLFSVFVWTLLTAIYIQFLDLNIWLIFLLGLPLQISIILWSGIKPKVKN